MGEVQTPNDTTDNVDAEKKRRISCDYPGMSKFPAPSQFSNDKELTFFVLGCDKSFLRLAPVSPGS